jgi:hypothetical protein
MNTKVEYQAGSSFKLVLTDSGINRLKHFKDYNY